MEEHRWEWLLPAGQRVTAILALEAGVESVFLGAELASRAARGEKPEGHQLTLPPDPEAGSGAPPRVTVTFDPYDLICVLRFDGNEIAPLKWPDRRRHAPAPPPRAPFPLGIVVVGTVAIAIACVVGLAVYALRGRSSASDDERTMSGVHRADNGLFVAHFPRSFAARAAVAPGAMRGILLEDRARAEAIVLLAWPLDSESPDPWLLQKRVQGEALANLPRSNGASDETARREGTCLGSPGAIVQSRVTNDRGDPARVWSCAFARAGAGYFAMYTVRETASTDDDKRLRRVVDATELTHLEDMSAH